MIRFTKFVALSSILFSLTSVARASGGTGGGGVKFAGVALSVSTETAPPGATAQAKISLTEPKPISTGGGSLSFSAFDSVFGIAVMGPGQDTYGVALERGTDIALSVFSTTASFGTSVDYPIITIAGRVPASAPVGTKYVLPIDPTAFHFLDPTGVPYPVDAKPGQLIAGTGVSIGDVFPGSSVVPAGGVVTITGTNFFPNTNIRFAEAKIAQVRYVSPTRIDVVLGQTATMHGMTILAKNPDGSKATYFSYQRTRPMSPSADPVMQFAVPLFPPQTVAAATVTLPPAAPDTTYGIALQNIDINIGAYALITLLDANGNVIAGSGTDVLPSTFVVRELSELFGSVPPNAAAVRVLSNAPIQVLGIAANQVAGTADPIVAQ